MSPQTLPRLYPFVRHYLIVIGRRRPDNHVRVAFTARTATYTLVRPVNRHQDSHPTVSPAVSFALAGFAATITFAAIQSLSLISQRVSLIPVPPYTCHPSILFRALVLLGSVGGTRVIITMWRRPLLNWKGPETQLTSRLVLVTESRLVSPCDRTWSWS